VLFEPVRAAIGFSNCRSSRGGKEIGMKGLVWAICLFGVGGLAQLAATSARPRPKQDRPAEAAHVRTYYIAAEETEWDYAPLGMDMTTGKPFAGTAAAYTQPGPNHIGHVYRKALYREYTDATFTKRKARLPQDEYMGLLGPVLRAEVGDTIKVVFKNNASRPYSMHPHGVFYEKASEGSMYADNVPDDQKIGDMVPPGATFTYEWDVPERAGPGPDDPSSIVWVYHSHVNEYKDVAAGLVGAIVVTRRGQANPDGTPKAVDREIFALFTAFNENQSWYVDQNVAAHISAADQKALNKRDNSFNDMHMYVTFTGRGFAETNFKFSINGYLYENGPVMTMKLGQRVRWYLLDVGDVVNFHTPHWEGGNWVTFHHARKNVFDLLPAAMETADMVPDTPGLWQLHCQVDDHMQAGMMARYEVLPAQATGRVGGGF
jgi:FtsP/CotA-like multicopper oxidase with cupredoxin domain